MSTTGASDDEHIAAGNAASSRVAGYELPLTGYGPSVPRINLDKLIKIPFEKEDIFVDFKHQFMAALEGKCLKRFITQKKYDIGLPENDPERLMQVYVYNSIAASLRVGGRFPVIRDVSDCNAFEAWQKVLERYEGQSTVTSMALKAQIWGRKLTEGESLTQLCDWLTERFQTLATTPEKMGETDKKLVLVMAIEKHPRYERIAATIRHDSSVLTYTQAVDLVRDEARYLDVLHSEEKLTGNVNQVVNGGTGGATEEKSQSKKKLSKLEKGRDKQRGKSRGRSFNARGRSNRRRHTPGRRHHQRNDSDDGRGDTLSKTPMMTAVLPVERRDTMQEIVGAMRKTRKTAAKTMKTAKNG